jgi:HD superfamily phosphohydrolase
MGHKETEDYQDQHHEEILRRFGVPAILEKQGISFKDVINKPTYTQYTLLEQPLPELCADRLDYALREFRDWANPEIVSSCVNSLRNYRGKIIFSSRETARSFGETFLKCQTEHWGGAEAVIRYTLLSDVLLLGLEQKIISADDFYQDDDKVLQKLVRSRNTSIQKTLARLRGRLEYVEDTINPAITSRKKFRYVDPEFAEEKVDLVITGGTEGKHKVTIHRLSQVDAHYAALIEEQRRINERGIKVRLV